MTAWSNFDPSFGYSFAHVYRDLCGLLLSAPVVHTGEWQAMDTSKSKLHATHELEDVIVAISIPRDIEELQTELRPSLPWAEDHFQERVSGQPLNPAPSHVDWPYAVRGNTDHLPDGFKFDHTYPERFWPKQAGCDCVIADECTHPSQGIRFQYGDLSDVVKLLVRSPMTRQAYLPVWFPEDTGAVLGQRVPCTLGYHFMIRGGDFEQPDRLSCKYFIRSCDIYRHFVNDLYMAARLTQWIANEINRIWSEESEHIRQSARIIKPNKLTMFISNLHAFVGDEPKLKGIFNER